MRRLRGLACIFLVLGLTVLIAEKLYAQQRVDSGNLYSRVLAVVPIVGKGTLDDPKRPMFAPLPSQMTPGDRNGIIAFHHEVSDDGQYALVEFVAVQPSALQSIVTAANLPGVKVFQRGQNTQAQVEAEFQKQRKDFRIDRFLLRVP